MVNLTSIKDVKDLLSGRRIFPKKGLGQNFLIDRNVVEHIVDSVIRDSPSHILEIGPGLGVITQEIIKNTPNVVCVETDLDMIGVLEHNLSGYDNLDILWEDFLKWDLNSYFKEEYKTAVVGNLPYYITTPIIEKIIENRQYFSSVTMMIQKEVAHRIKASPGTKEYGSLSVFINFYADCEIICNVSRNCFYPVPSVDSCVIRLNMLDEPRVKLQKEALFFDIVRSAFGKRRKTLLNALSNSVFLYWGKEKTLDVLTDAGIDPGVRGETLGIDEFAKIAEAASR